jgi:hypothetical protein
MNAFEIVGRVSLTLFCLGVFFLGLAFLVDKLKQLLGIYYNNVAEQAIRAVGRSLVNSSYWFTSNPDAHYAVRVIGKELADSGSLRLDMSNLRAQWDRKRKESA